MIPTCGYRTTLAEGDGPSHDVWALQMNLNRWRDTQTGLADPLVEDGDFGGRTHRRVRTFQRRRGLYVDGVAGPVSQRRLAIELLEPQSELYDLPHGLLRGQTELESAYFVGAVNCLVPGAKDCGWTQRRVPDGSVEAVYKAAFDGVGAFATASELLRKRKDRYYSNAAQAIKDHEYMWKAAAGAHNWPAGADQVAAGGFDQWRYKADGKTYGVDDPAQWVKNIGVPGVETAREWWNFYVSRATAYVDEWTH